MTFGSTVSVNPCGADEDKTAAKEANIFSAAPAGDFVAEVLGGAAACAACWTAAGAALSGAYVASNSVAVIRTLQLMLFRFFIPDPFVIANCSRVCWLKIYINWLVHQ